MEVDDDYEASGYVIQIFVDDPGFITRHNRVCGDENLSRLFESFCEVLGQCSLADFESRYVYNMNDDLLQCYFRKFDGCLIGFDDNRDVLEKCLRNSDLTSIISQGKGGGLLRQVGQVIQVKHNLKLKYDASLVRLSKGLFDLVGAK